jgi:hypothetical protein
MRNSKKNQTVAEICLYGTSRIGAGWIATLADGRMIGNGEPVTDRCFTSACWLAADAIRAAGYDCGKVRIYAAGGERMADADINHVPYFGNLEWKPAIQYTIDAAQLVA